MAEPSLGELLSARGDAALGTGAPAVVFDNRGLVNTLNQNAQFKAENDWRKYTNFQNNLKEVFKDAGEIANIETMEQDKPELKKRMGDVLNKIQGDPHAFFSGNGRNFAQLQGELAKIRSDAVASKQNNIYDKANREYLARNPELNTDENKKMIEGYANGSLGNRKAYILNLPGMFDPATLGKQINEAVKSIKPYTHFIDDGKFIESGTETSYDGQKWNAIAESMYNMPDDRGNLLRNTIQQRFSQLPKEVQDQYSKEPDPVKAFYMTSLEPFRSQGSVVKDKIEANKYAEEQQRAKDRLDELKIKHGYDVSIEGMKIRGAKDVATLKEDLKGKSKAQQFGYLNKLVDGQVNSAIADPNNLVTDPHGGPVPKYKMDVSTPVLHTFGYSTGSGIMKETTDADDMQVSGDGKTVTVVFYKRDDKGKIQHDKEGNALIDENKTKDFSKNEYKAIVGKELLGVSGSLKSLNTADEEDGDEEDFEYQGKKYSSSDIEEAAKASGMTVQEYKKSLPK
jgi:hypothetical protein